MTRRSRIVLYNNKIPDINISTTTTTTTTQWRLDYYFLSALRNSSSLSWFWVFRAMVWTASSHLGSRVANAIWTVAHWYDNDTLTAAPSQINFLIFVPIFSVLSVAYLEIAPRFMPRGKPPSPPPPPPQTSHSESPQHPTPMPTSPSNSSTFSSTSPALSPSPSSSADCSSAAAMSAPRRAPTPSLRLSAGFCGLVHRL